MTGGVGWLCRKGVNEMASVDKALVVIVIVVVGHWIGYRGRCNTGACGLGYEWVDLLVGGGDEWRRGGVEDGRSEWGYYDGMGRMT